MNWPYWFEVAIVFGLTTVGGILFERFAGETPKWIRLLKAFVGAGVAVSISMTAGRAWFFVFLAVVVGFVVVIHAWWLPKHGVNGLTAEPRERYYALRGWKMKQRSG
jgi:hypothetical protein